MSKNSLQYHGFAFRVSIDTIYQLPEPTYSVRYNTIDGLSSYTTICYMFIENIVTAKQFQSICTIKINLQKKITKIEYIDDIDISRGIGGKHYTLNELHILLESNYVKYQQPLLPRSKTDYYSCLCRYAQRLHFERQLHMEGVMFAAFFLNSKLDKNEQFSFKEAFKKGVSAYSNVLRDRRQKLIGKELSLVRKQAGQKGAQHLIDKKLSKIDLIKELLPECIKPSGKPDRQKLHELTDIPLRTLSRLLKELKSDE